MFNEVKFLFECLVPGAVSDLQLAEVEATVIKIIWRKPQQPNGIIIQYRVKVQEQETLVTLENTILGDKNKVLFSFFFNMDFKLNLLSALSDIYKTWN